MPEPRTLGDALRRYWILVAICAVILAVVGAAAGAKRSPVYSAQTGLTVGQLNLSVQSIPGFAVGGQALADTLSRSVTSPEVIDPAAKKLNVAPNYLAANVSASPVARTATFIVYGTGASERQAVEFANAVADSLGTYAQSTQSDGGNSARLLNRFHQAAQAKARADRRLQKLQPGVSSSTYSNAKAQADELALRAQVASDAYITSQQTLAAGAVIQRLAPAIFASSDRSSKVQLYGVLGAIAGALLGAALAVLWAGRRARRRRTTAA
jgi:capsular polysaccharide biosynthesis protein